VLTGEAAVTVGAEGEGMVAGDLVNTASRIQSVAEPGSVFVGDATRRATEQAVVYEPAGEHELKGKEARTALWRAQRIVSARRGELRSDGLEAPFVGRERELRQVKELFHASAEERRARLVSEDERRFVERGLAQLLGVGDAETAERQELFAAWRLFFERLADSNPTVLVFEDLQWADASLLDFIEYLLEWSRSHPL
jgi:hypothetical protein